MEIDMPLNKDTETETCFKSLHANNCLYVYFVPSKKREWSQSYKQIDNARIKHFNK